MAKNLKKDERVTVDRVFEFDADSGPFAQGLPRVEIGQVGTVVDAAPQGRASIVDFDGIQVTISNQRLARLDEKPARGKRGRKKKLLPTPKTVSKRARMSKPEVSTEASSEQIITQIANTLLLNGGLKDDSEAVIQLRFSELPEHIKSQIRALIQAKLDLNGTALNK
jgi:hypothetical protein